MKEPKTVSVKESDLRELLQAARAAGRELFYLSAPEGFNHVNAKIVADGLLKALGPFEKYRQSAID